MAPDQPAVVLRPRGNWEAIDLGFAMARRWWRPLWSAWLLCVLPVQLVVMVGAQVLSDEVWLGFVLLWWLKPLFDRVLLLVLSRSVFGTVPRLREVVRALPRLWLRRLIAGLLLLRLDSTRSFRAPVVDLEQQKGLAMFRRQSILSRGMDGPASWLTLTCWQVEGAIMLGIIAALALAIPGDPGTAAGAWAAAPFDVDPPWWMGLTFMLLPVITSAIVEPFYVAAGFALYLERRTRLEGWDVEIALRRMAARLEARAEPRVGLDEPSLGHDEGPSDRGRSDSGLRRAAPLVVAICLAGVASPRVASASDSHDVVAVEAPLDEAEARPADGPHSPTSEELAAAREHIDAVLADPVFGGKETRTVWLPRHDDEATTTAPEVASGVLAELIEWLLWALVGLLAAVGLALWIIRRERSRPAAPKSGPVVARPKVGRLAQPGLVLDGLPERALALWRDGQDTAALALLYAGAVRSLVLQFDLKLPDGATEGDCLAAARGAVPQPTFDFLRRLVGHWQGAAYAERTPETAVVGDLCKGWRDAMEAQP